ncbi:MULTISPECIES: autotransporter outer membrane beta-barrel domain-containing protein [Gilliamella]|uniref:Autotransporter outer membrane beta-barrel domain-containing protein n=1 Tax=Gilliamella apicola TaxID=1196095 RepID=A0A556SQ16_9GAMM|nr:MULTISPECIES: autotransporter outer membrane beta-barrel domain-containing protein [Gilliamella]MBI0094082.1 autotransporter outer membrane beta-barrel domain-containing protein [Gilliamella sp. W8136]TSK03234.1 autotransporter outer membrane beta-barrel domain-containing protein [Gilliamella apicola]
MKIKLISFLITTVFGASYAQAYNYDASTDIKLPFNQINERYFLKNSSNLPINITTSDDLTVNSEGSFHLGFTGKTATEPASIANGDINMKVNGNFHIYNDTWIGKFDTKFFTEYLGLHADFPYDPVDHNIDLHVTGDINVELGADKKRGGLMILSGNVMGTGPITTGKTTVKVDGDTNIRSGDNHLAGTSSSPAKLITRSFNITGGDIEIIGAKTVLETTNNDIQKSSVVIGKTGKMIIMRGGAVDLSHGGNFDVIDKGILTASRGDGFVKLSSNGQLNIDKKATIESTKGSLYISDQHNNTSHLNIAGTVNFGISDTKQYNTIRGDNVNILSSAKISATDDFIKNSLKYISSEINATVLSANNSLNISNIKDGETKALIQNIYGDLNFKKIGNELKFVNASNVTDFSNVQHAKSAAERQISRYYEQVGTKVKNIAKGFAQNLAKVSYQSLYNTSTNGNVSSDKSLAGDLNWDILAAIGRGNLAIENKNTPLYFNRNLAGLYNNNHGLHLTEIALSSFNYTRNTLNKRIEQFDQTNKGMDDNLWINLINHHQSANNYQGISGYKYTSNGFIVGYDKQIIDNFLVGTTFSYTSGKYKDKAASSNDSDINNYQIQLYSGYRFSNNITTSAYVGYTYGKNHLDSHDNYYSINEKFHSNTWNVGSTIGYNWQVQEKLTLIPSISLNYLYTENSSHNARYNKIDLVKYGKASNSAFLIPMDMTIDYSIFKDMDNQISLRAKTGYIVNLSHNEFDSDITINGVNGLEKMSTHTANRSKNQYNLGLGLTYHYNLFDFNIDYQYYGESKKNSNYITALAKFGF